MSQPTFSLDRWLILAAVLAAHAAALWGLTSATPLLPAASAEPSRLVAELITLEPPQPAPRASAPVKPAPASRPAPTKPAKPAKAEPAVAEVEAAPAASASSTAPLAAASAASPPGDSPSTDTAPSPAASPNADPVGEAEAAITPPSAHASHLHNRAPRYPAISRRLGEEGEVVLRLLVLADGSVGTASVERSSGHARLDAAALAAARQWRFSPARRGGQALDAWHTQALVFQLDA